MKRILASAILAVVISMLLISMPVVAADTQRYEEYTTGDDEAVELYGNIWGAQTFTTGTEAHSVTSIRLLLYREGSPGTITVSIRETTTTDPSGADLTSIALSGDSFTVDTTGVWYTFDVTSYSLEASTMYAILVRAPTGDATNSIHWRSDGSSGAEANGQEETSANGGLTWTGDADDDFMFEIWGEPIIEVLSAQVVSGYLETDDWLITLAYKNYYVPYYPNEDPRAYFYIQLLDDTTVKAQTSCLAWKYRPGSIYLSKALADTLEWSATDYRVRLYGDFGSNPSSTYTLVATDWRGTELTFLDSWVITQANSIGDDIGVDLTIDVADEGEVLNAAGHTMFSIGIPGLNEVRPSLFEMVTRQATREEWSGTHVLQAATDWETKIGASGVRMLNATGDVFGLGGKDAGAVILGIVFLGITALLAARGKVGAGLIIGYLVLLSGAWLGLIDYIWVAVLTFVLGGGMLVYKAWLTK